MVRALPWMMLLAGSATAAPARLEVAGEACDLSGLESQVLAIVGEDPFAADAISGVKIETAFNVDGPSAQAWFVAVDGTSRGPRNVVAPTCAELVESLAVIIAMALPELNAERPRPPIVVPASVSAQRELGLQARFDPGDSTSAQVVIAAAGGVSSRGWQQQLIVGSRVKRHEKSVGLELRLDMPREVEVTTTSGVDVWKAVVSLSPCLHLGPFGLCAMASAGALRGSGDGLIDARTAFSPVLAAGARLTWERPFTRLLALRLHVDAEAALTRTRFDVDHMPVWLSNEFEVWGGAGVIARIP